MSIRSVVLGGYGEDEGNWVLVPTDTKLKIAALSEILDTIVVQLKGVNDPQQQALSEIERAQLVAVLETVLAMLKAPMAERSLLSKALAGLRRVAANALENQVEQGLGTMASEGARLLSDFVKRVWP
jgi:hypothetical protein